MPSGFRSTTPLRGSAHDLLAPPHVPDVCRGAKDAAPTFSVDLEPHGYQPVPFDPPAVRDPVDYRQAPPTAKVRTRSGFGRDVEAGASVLYLPTHRPILSRYYHPDPVGRRKPGVEHTVGQQLAHHQPKVLQLRGRQERR